MMDQRHKNYIKYYEKHKDKSYSLKELMQMNEMKLLALMPNNQCVDKYSDKLECNVTLYIASFKMSKVIDGSWHIGYYQNHSDKMLRDQQTLFEITYVTDLKIGLIDLFLMVQNRAVENWNGIKSGRIKLTLSESWDRDQTEE